MKMMIEVNAPTLGVTVNQFELILPFIGIQINYVMKFIILGH